MQQERTVLFTLLTAIYVCQQYYEKALLPQKLQKENTAVEAKEYARVCAIRPVTRTCHNVTCKKKIKVKFSLEQAMKAQRGSTGITLLFPNLGARWGWVVNATPRPLYTRERPGTPCTGGRVGPGAGLDGCRKSRPTGTRSPDRPACNESLH